MNADLLDGYHASSFREKLSADRTYYISTTGLDTNDGLTAGTPFLTIQKGYDTAVEFDFNSKVVYLQCADGTYNAGLSITRPWIGGGTLRLTGNTSNAAAVTISTTSISAVRVTANITGSLIMRYLTLATTTSGACLDVNAFSTLNFNNIVFGSCAGAHISVNAGGTVNATGNYEISGGAIQHIANVGGKVDVSGRTITTISGTPAFSTCFAYATRLGFIAIFSMTFSGSATGVYYLVDTNSVIFVNGGGATYLPGNSAGTASTGGQYV